MAPYIVRRIMQMIPTLILISITAFVIIQLPPGDYITNLVASLEAQGEYLNEAAIASLRRQYGLDRPVYAQYFTWVFGVLRGDFGYSFAYNADVGDLIGSRLSLTIVLSLSTLLFTWIVAFPIGVYSATHQYSAADYIVTFFGFIGLATPNFLLALILMWAAYAMFGVNVSGLFSTQFIEAPWSFARVLDMINHLWVPMIVIGTAGTAGLIRILRANLLDELGKPYVDAARAKGVSEQRILYKYPIRIALIPFVSTIGWILPTLVSGATITSVVLNLPTTGPMLLTALQSQDMYLAGSFIMFLSFLTLIGTLVSDILLAWLDPRIRY